MKRQATDWVKIFENYISGKGFVNRTQKEVFKLNNQIEGHINQPQK